MHHPAAVAIALDNDRRIAVGILARIAMLHD